MSAPERIWANEGLEWHSFDCTDVKAGWTHPYILATPAALAASPEVQALRAERDEAIRGRDSWRDDYKALAAAIVGDTGLSAMTVATQARLFRPRAEAAEAHVAALTARVEGLTGAITFALSEYDAPNDIDEAMSKLRTELSKDAALSHNGRGE